MTLTVMRADNTDERF